tara:strand:- start:773 stop:1495 length:723 start_codon:yes stop_codon:yes gene_type:complete
MITNSELKYIKKLGRKRYRDLYSHFVVEGEKAFKDFFASNIPIFKSYSTKKLRGQNNIIVSDNCMKRMTFLKNSSDVLGIFSIPKRKRAPINTKVLVLDNVSDPGNLGSIIRLCDWFGFENIVCSEKTVDCYNPKVVQSSMGSLARVNIFYEDLKSYLSKVSIPVYGTFLNGEFVNRVTFPNKFVLIFGNESNGISKSINEFVSHRITIPKASKSTVDSLNINSATAIIMNEITNQSFKS